MGATAGLSSSATLKLPLLPDLLIMHVNSMSIDVALILFSVATLCAENSASIRKLVRTTVGARRCSHFSQRTAGQASSGTQKSSGSLQLGKILQQSQAGVLAFFGMVLHGREIIAPNARTE